MRMIGFWWRFIRLLKQKVNSLLQRAEDPVEALDLLDTEYAKDLRRMRKQIAAVITEEKRLQLELLRLQEQESTFEHLAGEMLTGGDDVAARVFAARAACARDHRTEVECSSAAVCSQRKELELIREEVSLRLEALRVRRQTARAESVASRATIAAREWMLALSASGAAREESLGAAHEALARLRCRSEALSQLQS